MVKGELIALEDARDLARRVLEIISTDTERIEVAGSIRRKKLQVHDVDIVLIPKNFTFPWKFANKLKAQMGAKLIKSGTKLVSLEIEKVQVDLYKSNVDAWGIHLLRWTGSADHNIFLAKRAQKLGLKLAVSVGVTKLGEVIASRTEREVFHALELDYIPPEERDFD